MNTEKRLKIIYLPRWYPHRYDPMPGLFIERHARAVAAFADVAVLYVHQDSNLEAKFEADRLADDELVQLKIYYRACRSKIPGLARLVNLFRYIRYHQKGLKLLRNDFGKPDLVHVNVLTRLGFIALAYQWLTGTPYVITEHWTRYLPHMDNFRGTFRKALSRLVVKKAGAVLPVTDNLRQAMERHGLRNKKYRIIPNVVDMSMFRVADLPRSGPVHFIHVSCFEDKQKNISGILRVLKRLSEVRQDWTCGMIGEGIHLEKLMAYAGSLELDKKLVQFHGLRENEALAKMMAEADFQLLFSRFENLPVVILESYACGVPVLSTDVGGISEHLDESLGMLIPSEDEEALFNRLTDMLEFCRKYDGRKIRKYAEEHFAREVVGKQLLKVYQEVLEH